MTMRRLLIVAAIVAVLYYGYDRYMAFVQENADIRAKASEKNDKPDELVDPVTSTAQRRRADEQAVNAASSKKDK